MSKLYVRAGRSRRIAAVDLASKEAATWLAEDQEAARFSGPFHMEGSQPQPTKEESGDLEWNSILIPLGCTAILGTAGTGKTTTLNALRAHLALTEPKRALVHIPYFEPEYRDALTSQEEFAMAFATAVQLAAPTHGYILVDSLRSWVTLGCGYESRLSSGGWDLAMFPALTALDSVAKRAGVHVVAAVYVDAMQISAAAPGDTVRSNALMHLLMQAVDGSVESTVLLGPSRAERGRFHALNRQQRMIAPITGEIQLAQREPAQVTVEQLGLNAAVKLGAVSLNGIGAEYARELVSVDALGSDDVVRDYLEGRTVDAPADAPVVGPPRATRVRVDTRAIHSKLSNRAGGDLDD